MPFPSFGRPAGGPTTPPEPAQSNNDPRERFISSELLLNVGDLSPEMSITPSELITKDSTLAIFEEAEAELALTTRGEAKKLISERIKERNRLRMLLEKSENELAKLLKKTPAEIAALRY